MTMTKQDMIVEVAKKLDCTGSHAKDAVNAVFEVVTENLQKRGNVAISGFGKFYIKHRDKRTARNPKTGETIRVPEKEVVAFKPGCDLTLEG